MDANKLQICTFKRYLIIVNGSIDGMNKRSNIIIQKLSVYYHGILAYEPRGVGKHFSPPIMKSGNQ